MDIASSDNIQIRDFQTAYSIGKEILITIKSSSFQGFTLLTDKKDRKDN